MTTPKSEPVATREEALLAQIGELYALVLRVSRRIPDREPLTSTQRLALLEIAWVGQLRLTNLASRMDTTSATASRAVDHLEELGLARRRADPEDGRAIQIVATAKGRRWSSQRRALFLEILRDVPAEIASDQLIVELKRLNRALSASTGHDQVARGALLAP